MSKRIIEYTPSHQRDFRNYRVSSSHYNSDDNDSIESSGTPTYTPRLSRSLCNESSYSELSTSSAESKPSIKWNQLQHNGPLLAPLYAKLPENIIFLYNGKPIELSPAAEEVATLYAKVLKSDFSQNPLFQLNFFNDFREAMSEFERKQITSFELCNFTMIHDHFQQLSETKKKPTPVIRYLFKISKEREIAKFSFCVVDGSIEKISDYKIESPYLFRGRGDHPKMGMVKPFTRTKDIIINCGADVNIETSEGLEWKDVIHDQNVSWLASWEDPVQHITKYMKLSPASHILYSNDINKFETARNLGKCIDDIRSGYQMDWQSPDTMVRQRGVALYFIDKLALRVGYEKYPDEPDTVGCCSLRVEHITFDPLYPTISLSFQGKDSIWYHKSQTVDKGAFENLKLFVHNKSSKDLLFDLLTAPRLSSYIKSLMPGLTPKVFRTYHASVTLQNQLDLLTANCFKLKDKLKAYKEANRKVAVLCNHQRALTTKCANELRKIYSMNNQLYVHTSGSWLLSTCSAHSMRRYNLRKRSTDTCLSNRRLTQKNTALALGTSKLNYIDPRITVAWCQMHKVPINKIFNRGMMEKFQWAINETDTFRF